nr:unnamed protein product [Spirometra erinaceieuropaei]
MRPVITFRSIIEHGAHNRDNFLIITFYPNVNAKYAIIPTGTFEDQRKSWSRESGPQRLQGRTIAKRNVSVPQKLRSVKKDVNRDMSTEVKVTKTRPVTEKN